MINDRFFLRGKRGKQWVYGGLLSMLDETIDPNTIGVCTGLMDEHQKEFIFEGDILGLTAGNMSLDQIIVRYLVVWVPKYAGFYCMRVYSSEQVKYGMPSMDKTDLSPIHMISRYYSIIGNKYDNPELIGGETIENN